MRLNEPSSEFYTHREHLNVNIRFCKKYAEIIIPMNEKRIMRAAPTSTTLRLAIFVMSIVCTFSVKVVDPVPDPQSPASILQKPSKPIPLLTMPGVGAFKFILMDAE